MINEMFMTFCASLTIFHTFESYSEGKSSKFARYLLFLSNGYLIYFIHFLLKAYPIWAALFSSLSAVGHISLFVLLYKEEYPRALLGYALADFQTSIVLILTFGLYNLLLPGNYAMSSPEDLAAHPASLLLFALLYLLSLIPLRQLFAKFKRVKKIPEKVSRFFIPFYITSIIITRLQPFSKTDFQLVISVIIVFLTLILFTNYWFYYRAHSLAQENHYLKTQTQLQEKHYEALQYQFQETAGIRSYIHGQIELVSAQAIDNPLPEIQEYLDSLHRQYDVLHIPPYSGNAYLDLTLSNHQTLCQKRSINLDISIADFPEQHSDTQALCSVLMLLFSYYMDYNTWISPKHPGSLKIIGAPKNYHYVLTLFYKGYRRIYYGKNRLFLEYLRNAVKDTSITLGHNRTTVSTPRKHRFSGNSVPDRFITISWPIAK